MRSVADGLRLDSARAVAELPAADRIALALRLGDEDVALFCTAHRASEADARRTLARARTVGRLRSCSNDPARL
jgi:hypothetical protein